MKYYHVLITVVLLLFTPFASANIITWTCDDTGDGAIVIDATWDGSTNMLNMSGIQYWYPGHVQGEFITDTESDPTVWILESLENQTNFLWTDYHIDIGMNKTFFIVGVVAPPDWIWTITPPESGQQLPNQPPGTLGWLGTIDYYAGTPIPTGSLGQFGFVVLFAGSVEFYTEQVPTPIPAPGAILLGSLGVGLVGWLRKRRTI